MIRLRPSAHSLWLACFMVACASSDDPNDSEQPLLPSGSNTVPAAPTVSGADPVATQGPTGSTTSAPPPTGSMGAGPTPTPTGDTAGTANPTPQPTDTSDPTSAGPTGTPTGEPTGTAPDTTGPEPDPTNMPPVDTTVPPEPDVPEPSLIVSSEDNYWQVGEVSIVDAGTANFTVDTSDKQQQWLGFGGTFNEAGWDALQDVTQEDRDRAIRLLFSNSDGAGFTWGRIPIGSSDYGIDRYSLNDTPGDYAMDNFSIERDEGTLIPYILAAKAVKSDIKFWASPWSPPGWMKVPVQASDADADSPAPDTSLPQHDMDTGWMPGDAQTLEAYALYFVKFVQAYAEQGIVMDHVQPQNEPGWQQMYPTCGWGQSNFYGSQESARLTRDDAASLSGFVRDYLKPALANAGLGTKVWFGTLSNDRTFPFYMEGVTPDLVEGVALQWETVVRVESLIEDGFVVMQSEHRCGNYPWGSSMGYVTHQTPQSPNELAPNDFNYGQESWDLLTDWIGRGVNIYSTWNMILDTHGTNLDTVRVWNQNALIVVDRDTGELIVTPTYYVFRHLAQYVEPGATRVNINGDALAFQNPDGSVVAVMRTTAPGTQTVSIDGTLLQFEATGNGWVTVNWQGE